MSSSTSPKKKKGEKKTKSSSTSKLGDDLPNTQTTMEVVFTVSKECKTGEIIGVTGSTDSLGNWENFLEMKSSDDQPNKWTFKVSVPKEEVIEYKYIILPNKDWEQGDNREFCISQDQKKFKINDKWEKIENGKVDGPRKKKKSKDRRASAQVDFDTENPSSDTPEITRKQKSSPKKKKGKKITEEKVIDKGEDIEQESPTKKKKPKKSESKKKIIEEKSIDSSDSDSSEPMAATKNKREDFPADKVVKEGYLDKKGANRHNWTSRWFRLRKNDLCYFKDQKLKGIIPLEDAEVISTTHAKRQYVFIIKTLNREYVISANSSEEKEGWIQNIQFCIDQCSIKPILTVAVELKNKKQVMIDIYEDDDPEEKSREFCETYHLNSNIVAPLKKRIVKSLKQIQDEKNDN